MSKVIIIISLVGLIINVLCQSPEMIVDGIILECKGESIMLNGEDVFTEIKDKLKDCCSIISGASTKSQKSDIEKAIQGQKPEDVKSLIKDILKTYDAETAKEAGLSPEFVKALEDDNCKRKIEEFTEE